MVARKLVALTLLTMGFAAFATPTASAQGQAVTTNLECGSAPGDIRPLGSPGQWSCTASVTWPGGVSDPANPVTVQVDATNQQSWMNVIISPSAMTFIPEGGGGQTSETQEKSFRVLVSLTQNAPAFQTTQLQLQPTTTAPQESSGAQSTQDQGTDIAVTPGYFNLYNVRMDKKIAEGGPDSSVDFPVIIDNFSNGDTRFEFSLVGEEAPTGYQPVVPSPLVIRSQATGGEQTQGQAIFQVFTPYSNGYVNRIASIQLDIQSFYAADTGIEGASSTVSTLTKTKGFYVPGPGAPLAALGVLGAALALARGRRNPLDD